MDRDRIFFLYLKGYAPDASGLDHARLNLTATRDFKPNDAPWSFEERLDRFPQLRVRRAHGNWTAGLEPGPMELLADFTILSLFVETGNHTFRVEALLPDDRVLFSFEQTVYLERKDT